MSSENQSTETSAETSGPKNKINLKVVYNKKTYEISIELEKRVSELKQEIEKLTSVAPDMQKLILKGKGINENDKSLSSFGIKNKDKILMVGSTLTDVAAIAVSSNDQNSNTNDTIQWLFDTPFCKQKKHKKIIDKGVPEHAMPANKTEDQPIPDDGIKGMLNQYMKKCRLAFKLESDQFWVCLEHKTIKHNITSITSIEYEPIEGHEEYYIMMFRMKTRLILWFYWVPKQYINAIRSAVRK